MNLTENESIQPAVTAPAKNDENISFLIKTLPHIHMETKPNNICKYEKIVIF